MINDNIFSIGTSVMINNLIMHLSIPTNNKDTILINVDTVLRNRYIKNIPIPEWVNTTIQELFEIIREITNALTFSNKHYVLILYHASYGKMIPKELWRNPTDSRIIFKTASDILTKQLTKSHNLMENNYYIELTRPNPIATQLANIVKRTLNKRNIYLISHAPIDYHITEIFNNVEILESYTGKIITKKELGMKVFNKDSIPFNEYTHAILGNKEQFKPSIGVKQKKELIELSINETWSLRTKPQIKSSLTKHNFSIPFKLI